MASTVEQIREIRHKINIIEGRINTGGGGGVGNHNILSAVHPDSIVGAAVAGDLIYADATPKWTRFPIGAAARYLRSDGAAPVWAQLQLGDLPAHAAEHEIGGGDLVDHDILTNFVANEHIDHTAVTLTAGEGLTGGGDISANRTFDLDINGLVEDAGATSGDFFVYWDTIDGVHYKLDYDDLPGAGGVSPWTVDVNDIYWDGTGHCTIGATAPDTKMTVAGFNIYTPATADTLHFAIQNADVAHGFTAYANADTYLAIQKNSSAAGGAWIAGFSDATTQGMRLWGLSNAAPGGFATNSVACLDFAAAERSGTGGTKMGDTDNAFAWINWTTTIMLLKGRGDLCFPDSQCRILLGDSVNTFMDSGITINQKAYDTEILAFKSTDIAQPFTVETESDTYAFFEKNIGASGGLRIVGVVETGVDRQGLSLEGAWATGDTTKSAAGEAAVQVIGWDANVAGTGFAAYSAGENIFAIKADKSTAVWLADVDGDSWQSGTLTCEGHITSPTVEVWSPGSIADDGFAQFTPVNNYGKILIMATATPAVSANLLATWRIPNVHATAKMTGWAQFDVTVGPLTGVTGVNGNITFSADSASGDLFLENRAGAALTFQCIIFY